MDAVLAQAHELQETLRKEEARCKDLQAANGQAEEALAKKEEGLAKKTQELNAIEARLAKLDQMGPSDQCDEVLRINAGGQVFQMYRSTLSLFKDSVLAAMVSARWTQEKQQNNGEVFLDIDPQGFQEIVAFLRRRRISSLAKSRFSTDAALLALYLEIPVDSIKGEQIRSASFQRLGDTVGEGLAFDLHWSGPHLGRLMGLAFTLTTSAQYSIFMKAGTHEDALDQEFEWSLKAQGEGVEGKNEVSLPAMLESGGVYGVYIFLDKQALLYSNERPAYVGSSNDFILGPGRGVVRPRFTWPPVDEDTHLATSHRYFSGDIKYSVID